MNDPKITVVIPTRERCDVLRSALRTVTSQDYDNLEILISDNDSADATREVVAEARDPRIRYIRSSRRLSMSYNWDFALSHIQDGWVTLIGDDDGLLPNSIQRIATIINNTQSNVIRTDYCTYDWPGIPDRPDGQLIVPLTSGARRRDSRKWLTKVLNGHTTYKQLPMIYNGGFIHYDVLRAIHNRMGQFFSSANPDVYSAVAVATTVPTYLYVNEPLAISGTSTHSNGYSAFSKNANRNRKEYSTFLSEGNIPFHADMPLLDDGSIPLSLQACVYEAYLQCTPLVQVPITGANHEAQLITILATAGKHRALIEGWGRKFALLHELNYANAIHAATRLRPRLGTYAMGEKLFRALRSVITSRLPLHDVYEASIAASVIRAAPSRRENLRLLGSALTHSMRHSPAA